MGKIICLMGKSSSGKDTIFKRIMDEDRFSLRTIVPYTTRPIRAGERDGVEYHFTDEAGYQALLADGKVIEGRAYHTCLGLWRYFTVADEEIDPENHSYLVIGTLESYVQLRRYYGTEKVLSVMIELDDGERLQRALDRERSQHEPKYEEMCRRFLADAEDFAADRIESAGIDRCFYNGDLTKCLTEIYAYLQENL